jgi:uncharacterized protein
VVTTLTYPAESDPAGAVLILGHGAGAGQHSPWMVDFARDLSGRGLDIVTFNFPYIEQGRKVPDRRPLLDACYRAVIAAVQERAARANHAVFIGGKSMGGRIATHVAAAEPTLPVKGLVLLGYPLHPPGRPDERRDAHLPAITRPMLFVQGTRDAFGTPAELQPILEKLAPLALLHVVEGGDHSFKIGRKDPARQAAALDDVRRTIADWIGAATRFRPVDAPRSRTR